MKTKTLTVVAVILLVLAAVLPQDASTKTVRVAMLPLQVLGDNAALLQSVALDMLQAKIGKEGSIEVVKGDAVKAVLNDAPNDITDIRAALAGGKLNADYVVYGRMKAKGQSFDMDIKLLSVKDGAITAFSNKSVGPDALVTLTGLAAEQVLAAIAPAITAPAEVKGATPVAATTPPVATTPAAPAAAPDDGFIIKPKEATERPVIRKSKRMDGIYIAMTEADLDRDGTTEIFLLNRDTVIIGRLAADGLDIIKEIKTPVGVANAAIAAIDSNADGSVEVYVSGVFNDQPNTSVIEWKDGSYAITASGMPWLVRVMSPESGASVLAGQKFRGVDGFYGGIKTLKMQAGGLVETGTLVDNLPSGADVYRTEIFDATGSGAPQAIVLDQRGYFRIFNKDGKGKWAEFYKSKDWFGGTLNRIEFTEENLLAQKKTPVDVEGGLGRASWSVGGKPEIIVKRNTAGGLGRYAAVPASFIDGEIVSLSWDKDSESLLENWKTQKVEGYIADYFIETDTATGAKELVILIVEGTGGYLGDAKSYILSRKLAI